MKKRKEERRQKAYIDRKRKEFRAKGGAVT
jgi:hypothetical protein